MKDRNRRLQKAAKDLQTMLEEIEPYIRRPVVSIPSTKGRWTTAGAHDHSSVTRDREDQQEQSVGS